MVMTTLPAITPAKNLGLMSGIVGITFTLSGVLLVTVSKRTDTVGAVLTDH